MTQTDTLEQSLINAANDASLHYAFYNDFSASEVFALLLSELPKGKSVVEKNTAIQLQEMTIQGKHYIPVFSSLTKLQDFVKKDVRYIGVHGRDLVSMIQGRELFLNPGSHYSKIITGKEMQYLNSAAPSALPEHAQAKPTLLKKLFGGKK